MQSCLSCGKQIRGMANSDAYEETGHCYECSKILHVKREKMMKVS